MKVEELILELKSIHEDKWNLDIEIQYRDWWWAKILRVD
jgi:hypothetical protein